jgi:hypothetical protein
VLRQSRRLTMPTMSSNNLRTDELRDQLIALDLEFDSEMRARGFDPAQAENVALPSHLAALYTKRERIKAELDELAEGENDD